MRPREVHTPGTDSRISRGPVLDYIALCDS